MTLTFYPVHNTDLIPHMTQTKSRQKICNKRPGRQGWVQCKETNGTLPYIYIYIYILYNIYIYSYISIYIYIYIYIHVYIIQVRSMFETAVDGDMLESVLQDVLAGKEEKHLAISFEVHLSGRFQGRVYTYLIFSWIGPRALDFGSRLMQNV